MVTVYYSPRLPYFFCDIGQLLLNTVIIVTYFVWVQNCVFVIAIIMGECAILILLKLRFLGLCVIFQSLLNTVIIVTYFVWGQHCVFVITIVTGECAILILKILRFGVCHS